MTAHTRPKQDTLFVGSLAKGLRLLRAFDEVHTEMSLGDLARRTGLDRSAVQRLANTLHVEGMLDKDPATRRFRPSLAWLEMAYGYYWSNPLIAAAMPRLIELSRAIGETVNLAELSGDHIVYSLRLPTQRSAFAATVVGRKLPALATTSGRAMLSSWPEDDWRAACESWALRAYTARTTTDRAEVAALIAEAARDGYAMARDQMILNELAIAAPIPSPDGQTRAAVQVSVSAHRYDADRLRRDILPALQDAANAIAA